MGAQSEARCQKTSSVAGARGIARPRARAADDLSAQGSGLCARQAKGSSHAPEIPTPTQAVNLRFNIDGLTKVVGYRSLLYRSLLWERESFFIFPRCGLRPI